MIRLTAELGSSVTTNYIEPSVRLSEDAYVFAISVDVDRNIQVLHPEFPGLTVKMMSRKQLHLPSFFAGYAERGRSMGATYGRYGLSSYDDYDPGFADTRGTVIALASRRPFNLDAVTIDGSWDVNALRRLVEWQDPLAAASALARYLGARGEPIGRDVYRFAGAPRYYASAQYQCDYYGSMSYYGLGVDSHRAAQLRAAGYVVKYIGIDACGVPRYRVYGQAVAQTPAGRGPAVGAFPKSRGPKGVPRNPSRDEAVGDWTGSRSRTGERSTYREVPMTPPRGRADPRPVDRYNPRSPATGAFPERMRAPERVSPPARVDVPERRSAPPPPPPVERARPMPAPESRPQPEVRAVDQ